MLDEKIQALHAQALEKLETATTLEAVEAVRIEALGRKGKLADLSKEKWRFQPGDDPRWASPIAGANPASGNKSAR